MKFGSVCSGIEAASVAWHPLGWESLFLSEIEPFPCTVLNHHYSNTPNLGDMTKFKEWPDAAINVLVGGTPCQSFSVAGLRKGLADPRGNLMLTYLAIADRYRPEWLVWENVPGVLSSNGGRDFASLLRGLAELGYGFAYRILDAQYCGVPQRRRRVFVVGCLGSWQRAAAVLFERHSLQGHNPPSRKAGQEVAASLASSSGGCNDPNRAGAFVHSAIGIDEECNATVDGFGPLLRGGQGGTRQAVAFAQNTRNEVRYANGDGLIAGALAAESGMKQTTYIMSTGQAGAEIGIGIGTTLNCNHEAPIVCHGTQDPCTSEEVFFALGRNNGQENVVAAFSAGQSEAAGSIAYQIEQSPTLRGGASGTNMTPTLHQNMQVRRLTPMECERLQGFPDGYTNITIKGKPAADGPRYKALGNSMAVPVIKWIGERIQSVNNLRDLFTPQPQSR